MNHRKPRWWPLVTVGVLYLSTLTWTWWIWDASSRQNRVMATVAFTVLALGLALLWLVLLSRLPWKARLFGILGFFLFATVVSQTLEVRGVSGDLVPILAWRWSKPVDETLDRDLSSGLEGIFTVAAPEEAGAFDFPQFLGPNRNATLDGIRLERDWELIPPELMWRQPIGAGWSGFAVVGDCAVTLEQRGPQELTICYDLEGGMVIWSHSDAARFEQPMAGLGPRSTPTVVGGSVLTQGATGVLNRLDLATGRPIWSVDLREDNATEGPIYGFAASPLLVGDQVVVVAPGAEAGSLVAYDQETGERLWRGGDAKGRYSSPTTATLLGREQILLFYHGALRGHDPETGETLWEFPWPGGTEEASQPIALSENRVFLSSGYGIGSKVIELAVTEDDRWGAELVWEAPTLKAKFTNPVVYDGTIYGLDDGILVAIDPATGDRHWKHGRFGHGHVLLVEDLLLVLSEKGEVALIDPQPTEYLELGRFQAIEGRTWNTPALAGPYLLVRNAQEAACYRLPLEQ